MIHRAQNPHDTLRKQRLPDMSTSSSAFRAGVLYLQRDYSNRLFLCLWKSIDKHWFQTNKQNPQKSNKPMKTASNSLQAGFWSNDSIWNAFRLSLSWLFTTFCQMFYWRANLWRNLSFWLSCPAGLVTADPESSLPLILDFLKWMVIDRVSALACTASCPAPSCPTSITELLYTCIVWVGMANGLPPSLCPSCLSGSQTLMPSITSSNYGQSTVSGFQ